MPHSPSRCRSLRCRAALLGSLVALAGASPGLGATINAIGVENEYADVIRQVGGSHVSVSAIETDPNTDPHTFEVSPKVAAMLAGANLVVENGVGYDAWADKIMRAAAAPNRQVINVQHLLGLPDGTPNPHLWYDPQTMPRVADAVARDLSVLDGADAVAFRAGAQRFVASLAPWRDAIAAFKVHHAGIAVAVTEPVANYMLQAAGCQIATPFALQAAIMNGTDPSPQDVTRQNDLFSRHQVAVLVYNQQVTDSLTQSFLDRARANHIPVVGVYETMPSGGYDYQSWMIGEVAALRRAVETGASTETLARH